MVRGGTGIMAVTAVWLAGCATPAHPTEGDVPPAVVAFESRSREAGRTNPAVVPAAL